MHSTDYLAQIMHFIEFVIRFQPSLDVLFTGLCQEAGHVKWDKFRDARVDSHTSLRILEKFIGRFSV